MQVSCPPLACGAKEVLISLRCGVLVKNSPAGAAIRRVRESISGRIDLHFVEKLSPLAVNYQNTRPFQLVVKSNSAFPRVLFPLLQEFPDLFFQKIE